MGRNRYADLLRVVAIGAVVYGHWLVTDITYQVASFPAWTPSTTSSGAVGHLAFQVMPLFFLVGGYVNALSWTAHHARGESWTRWVRGRAMRLLWPTTVFVVVAVLAVAQRRWPGCRGRTSRGRLGGRIPALVPPGLPAAEPLTPALLAAHRRWGPGGPGRHGRRGRSGGCRGNRPALELDRLRQLPAGVGLDAPVGLRLAGRFADPLPVAPATLAAAGVLAFAGLVTLGRFPVDMIGAAGEKVGNTTPPSVALLAFGAAQTGLVLAAEPAVSRWLAAGRGGGGGSPAQRRR